MATIFNSADDIIYHSNDINTTLNAIADINTNGVLCDGCLQILDTSSKLSDKFERFSKATLNTYIEQNQRIDALESNIKQLEKQILILNNKIEANNETQRFMVVTADVIHNISEKIKNHIRATPDYKKEYGRFWQNDFWDDVKHGDPLAVQIYTDALAAFSINRVEYERIIRLKDVRNATYHVATPLDTPAKANAALDALLKQIPRVTTAENLEIIAILKKYVRVL